MIFPFPPLACYVSTSHCLNLLEQIKKGDLVHKPPTNVGSKEGKMYAALPPFLERLFPWLEPVPPETLTVSLTVGPHLTWADPLPKTYSTFALDLVTIDWFFTFLSHQVASHQCTITWGKPKPNEEPAHSASVNDSLIMSMFKKH